MNLKEVLNRLKENENEINDEPVDDDTTKDKALRSLRRMDRVNNEEVEKEVLKKRIAAFQKERMKKHLFGIKREIQAKSSLGNKLKKRKARKMLSTNGGMLGKSNLI